MANKKRPSLTGLTTGNSALARHVSGKGETTHDAPAKAAAKAEGDRKMVFLQTRLSEQGWQSLKMLSVTQRKPMQGLVIEALNALLQKYGQEANVTGPEPETKEK
jgi:hypothetical protein